MKTVWKIMQKRAREIVPHDECSKQLQKMLNVGKFGIVLGRKVVVQLRTLFMVVGAVNSLIFFMSPSAVAHCSEAHRVTTKSTKRFNYFEHKKKAAAKQQKSRQENCLFFCFVDSHRLNDAIPSRP